MRTTKYVDFAYPTSDTAKKFGHYSAGCWTVNTQSGAELPQTLAAYATRHEAATHADRLPHEYATWSNHETAADRDARWTREREEHTPIGSTWQAECGNQYRVIEHQERPGYVTVARIDHGRPDDTYTWHFESLTKTTCRRID